MLSEKLDIPFYDRELLRMASDDSGIHERLFGQADERVKPGLRKPFGKVYKGDLLPPESDDFVSDDNLFNYQAKIIKELADTRSCVIVGRCADFILQDRPNVVKLFVHAPFESCVKTVMDMYALPQKEAEKKIQDTDRHRSAYYKYYTGRNWDNAQNYDLCLNSAELGFDKCVEIVEAYMNIRFQ